MNRLREHADVLETMVNASEAGLAIVPQQPMLMGNYPNPVRSSTRIGFLVPDGGADRARVEIFDLHGRLVRTFERDNVAQGYQEFVWDGTDVGARPVAAGVYFYRLEVAGETFNHRMVLIR